MISPSHQAAAAKMLVEINLMSGPAELNSIIAMLTRALPTL
jgi:hypothetical protein